MTNDTHIELKEMLRRRGARLIGIGSVDRFEGAPKGHHPRDFLEDARSVVAIGLPIVRGLMGWNRFMEGSERIPMVEKYTDAEGTSITWSPRTTVRKHIERRCSYEVINMELNTLSMYAAIFLEEHGYRTAYLPATYGMTLSWPGNYRWDFPKPPMGTGPFSHRHAAVASGLGRFGRNNLLLTRQYGPRQRLVSLITEAPLQADPLIEEEICLGEPCSRCVEACPAGAFCQPHTFPVGGVAQTVASIDIEACRGYYKDSAYGEQCGRECMTACPLLGGTTGG